MAINPLSLIQAGLALPQAIFGTWQYLNAVKQAKNNVRPEYNIDPAFQNQIDLLTANYGLPQSALASFYNQAGQGATQGINAILSAGGNPNMIAGLINQQNRNFQDVLVKDALAKKADLTGIINAQLQLAGEKDKAFQINKFAPYADSAQAIAQQKNAGLQNITGAFNTASSGIGNALTAGLYDSKITDTTKITPTTTGVDYSQIIKMLPQNQSGFQNYSQPASNMNLGMNNFSSYNLPNYYFNTPMFGQQQQQAFMPDFSFYQSLLGSQQGSNNPFSPLYANPFK